MSAASARRRSAAGLIVIGGTSRAASTSLFRLLSAHPELAAAAEKECRFFLPAQVPLPSRSRFPARREDYVAAFEGDDPGDRLLDATPDYLHYPGCEENLHAYFPDAQIVFVLRDPVERLLSWSRYARQRGLVPAGVGFRGFMELQLDAAQHPFGPTHLLARAHGAYAPRVRAYLERFGPERVRVLYYEDLRSDPTAFLDALGSSLELDLEGLRLPHENRSRGVRSTLLAGGRRGLERWARSHLRGRAVRRVLAPLRRAADGIYWGLNRAPSASVAEEPMLEALTEAYRPSVEELAALLGAAPPWPRWAAAPPQVG